MNKYNRLPVAAYVYSVRDFLVRQGMLELTAMKLCFNNLHLLNTCRKSQELPQYAAYRMGFRTQAELELEQQRMNQALNTMSKEPSPIWQTGIFDQAPQAKISPIPQVQAAIVSDHSDLRDGLTANELEEMERNSSTDEMLPIVKPSGETE